MPTRTCRLLSHSSQASFSGSSSLALMIFLISSGDGMSFEICASKEARSSTRLCTVFRRRAPSRSICSRVDGDVSVDLRGVAADTYR